MGSAAGARLRVHGGADEQRHREGRQSHSANILFLGTNERHLVDSFPPFPLAVIPD